MLYGDKILSYAMDPDGQVIPSSAGILQYNTCVCLAYSTDVLEIIPMNVEFVILNLQFLILILSNIIFLLKKNIYYLFIFHIFLACDLLTISFIAN